jgi:DNA helicase HerA-like ATPase
MPLDAGGPEPVDRLQVSGYSGAGKSALTRALLKRRKVPRFEIFDVEDEYEGTTEDTVRTREELYDFMTRVVNDEEETWSVRYVPQLPDTDDAKELEQFEAKEAGYLAHLALWAQDNVLVIDEAHNSCGQHLVSGYTLKVAKTGRKRGVYLWVISQGPKDVSTKVRKELRAVEEWFLHLEEEGDLDLVKAKRKLGGEELADRVARLPDLHAIRVARGEEPEEWVIIFHGWDAAPTIVRAD